MLKISQHNQKGFFVSNITTTALWTIVVLISATMSILFALSFVNNLAENSIKGNLVDNTEDI